MEKMEFTLTGPAKVGGIWRKPGESVSVDAGERGDLIAAGVIGADDDDVTAGALVEQGFDAGLTVELVKRAVAERDANWATALDHFQSMAADEHADAIVELKADHQAEVEKIEARWVKFEAEAVTEVSDLRKRVAELEAAAAVKTDTPAAQKKSAATKA